VHCIGESLHTEPRTVGCQIFLLCGDSSLGQMCYGFRVNGDSGVVNSLLG